MKRILVSFAILLMLPTPELKAAERQFVSIGTGGVTGVYYPVGSAICRLLNRSRSEHNIRCAVESTNGSVENLQRLATGDLDLAIVQSDAQFRAYEGKDSFSSVGPNPGLRAVFSLHSEPFTLVVRKESNILKFEDLPGKRVNIGNPGSGQRSTMDVVMAEAGWAQSDFSQVFELDSVKQARALCADKFDAMVFTVGHPSGSIKEATSSCATQLVNVEGPVIDRLVAENEYYVTSIIPGRMYRGTEDDIKTFGVAGTFVTTREAPDEVVYQFVKTVFDNFTEFKSLHPALAALRKEEMVTEGLTAPLHPGAIRYYRSVGLLD